MKEISSIFACVGLVVYFWLTLVAPSVSEESPKGYLSSTPISQATPGLQGSIAPETVLPTITPLKIATSQATPANIEDPSR